MNNEGLVVYEQCDVRYVGPGFVQRPTVKSLDFNDIFRKYKGIEAHKTWPNRNVFEELGVEISRETHFADFRQIEKVKDVCETFFPNEYHVIYVALEPFRPEFVGHAQEKYFKFLGYDYGYLFNAIACYSLIFNDILFFRFDELGEYGQFLNENLLFPDLRYTEQLGLDREKLVSEGKDLESYPDGHPFQPIAIWGIK